MTIAIKAPSRWHYVIGIAVLVVGFAVFGVFLFTRITSLAPDIQVVVPGTHEIYLGDSGKYTVFYEYRSVVDDRIYSTGESLSGLGVTLKSKRDSREVAMSTPSGTTTYEIGGRAGVSVLKFEVEEQGTYILSADYVGGASGPDVVLAIGKFNILGTILIALGIFFGTLSVGGFIILRTFLKRRKASRQMAGGSA
jgi:hypothetical protein